MSWAASSRAPSCHACCAGVAVAGSCPARAPSQRSAIWLGGLPRLDLPQHDQARRGGAFLALGGGPGRGPGLRRVRAHCLGSFLLGAALAWRRLGGRGLRPFGGPLRLDASGDGCGEGGHLLRGGLGVPAVLAVGAGDVVQGRGEPVRAPALAGGQEPLPRPAALLSGWRGWQAGQRHIRRGPGAAGAVVAFPLAGGPAPRRGRRRRAGRAGSRASGLGTAAGRCASP